VVEGRDIGTVVAPGAALKVYLSADPKARAKRRAAELAADQKRDLAHVEQTLVRRDANDSSRATAPLAAADDAVLLDTTDLTLDEVTERGTRVDTVFGAPVRFDPVPWPRTKRLVDEGQPTQPVHQ
jgi:cytidylate kinase